MTPCTCKRGCKKCYPPLNRERNYIIYAIRHEFVKRRRAFMKRAPRLGEYMTLRLDRTTNVKGRVVKLQTDGTFRIKFFAAAAAAAPAGAAAGPLEERYVNRAPASRLTRKKPRFSKAWSAFLCERAGLLGGAAEVSGPRWEGRGCSPADAPTCSPAPRPCLTSHHPLSRCSTPSSFSGRVPLQDDAP